MISSSFVEAVAKLKFENAFNPYSDICPDHDCMDAPMTRRKNLELVLEAALNGGVDSIWIARDLGYRGGRRTGLALTDEVHLDHHAKLYGSLALNRATRGPSMSERTATVIWQVLRTLNQPVFLWNVFPLHPHEGGDALSNRCHTREERRACGTFLSQLISALDPKFVVAIGRDAQMALTELEIDSVPVRHPSYGGQSEFLGGIYRCYGLERPEQSVIGTLI
jgi:hypothetical protein